MGYVDQVLFIFVTEMIGDHYTHIDLSNAPGCIFGHDFFDFHRGTLHIPPFLQTLDADRSYDARAKCCGAEIGR